MGAGGQGGAGYEIDQSIRFNDGDSPYLNRTLGTPTSSSQFGYSFWVKLGAGYDGDYIISANGGGNNDNFSFYSNKIYIQEGGVTRLVSNQLFRDFSSWYHFVVAYDLGNATASQKLRVYLNGSEITSWATDTRSSLSSTSSRLNAAVSHDVGANVFNGVSSHINNWDGYIAEFHFVDGTVLTPADFGKYNDDGVWIPIQASPTYGNNGFYITGETASDLGEDFSGNNNDFTSSGLTTADQMLDTPTLNASTLNPLWAGAGLSDGNLVATATGNSYQRAISTFAIDDGGKYACEFQKSSGTFGLIGIMQLGNNTVTSGNSNMYGYNVGTGEVFKGNPTASVLIDLGAGAANSLMRVEYDSSADTIKIFDDGVEIFPAATGVSNTVGLTGQNSLHFGCAPYGSGTVITATFQGLSGTPTADFKELTSANLATPSITDGSKYFQPTLYNGTGSELEVDQAGNSTFQPDFAWIKNRTNAGNEHDLYDAVRGATKVIFSSTTGAESTQTQGLKSFDSDGFTVGTRGEVNTSGSTNVAWQWLANNTTGSTNDDGSVDSTVAVNTTAGFSIVKWVHTTSANYTVGHGLGATPKMILVKTLDQGTNWGVYHSDITVGNRLILNTTAAQGTGYWGANTWNSTVFSIGSVRDANSSNAIAYVFAEIPGYSSIGSYTGNGSTDGPMIYTGFKPAFVILKRTNATQEWQMYDTERDPFNVSNHKLEPNSNSAESILTSDNNLDFLSNGFKLRKSNGGMNASGSTYIYIAFAEHPFGGDGVAPATAR